MASRYGCRALFALSVMAGLMALVACDRSAGKSAPRAEGVVGADLATELDGLLLSEAPDGAVGPVQARTAAGPVERIVLVGEIGGRKVGTFGDSLATFFLADYGTITNCSLRHGDGCPTPWDYCCEPKEMVTASLALIQFKSPGTGQVLPRTLKGWHGLRELSRVTVVGNVDAASSPTSLVVNLEGIYLHPEQPRPE